MASPWVGGPAGKAAGSGTSGGQPRHPPTHSTLAKAGAGDTRASRIPEAARAAPQGYARGSEGTGELRKRWRSPRQGSGAAAGRDPLAAGGRGGGAEVVALPGAAAPAAKGTN